MSRIQTYFYPFIRLVGKARLALPIAMSLKGGIGGFGVSSDLTWTVYGGFEFQIARHFYTDIGCRYFGTDYSSGAFKYDVSLIGPQIEMGLSFNCPDRARDNSLLNRY
jgi:hypothetical protein